MIKILSKKELNRLFYNFWIERDKSSHGLFLSQHKDGRYIGVDSLQDEIFVETSEDLLKIIEWLNEDNETNVSTQL